MRINQNIAALNTYRQLSANNTATGKSLEKLSSGLRINRAGDDAAGLAISEKMRAQVRGLDAASRNSQDAISLIQTAEGALNETQSILQRMRELGVQASSDTNVAVDRGEIQKEMNQLTSEINRIANTTEFNTMKLLNGDRSNTYQVTSAVTTASINSGGATLTAGTADVTFASAKKPTFSGDAVSVTADSGNFIYDDATSGGFALHLSGDKLIVSGFASSGTSTSAVSGYYVVDKDTDGGYSFSGNGVSFHITSVDGWDSGTANAITYTKNSGVTVDNSLSTKQNVWSSISPTGSGTAATFNDIIANDTITLNSGMTEGHYNITISSTDNASGSITITRSGLDGTQVTVAKISGGVTSGFVFDDQGISFSISGIGIGGGIGSGGSGTLSFTVQKEVSTATSGGADNSLTFQIGANENQSMALSISKMDATALGVSAAAGGTNASGVTFGNSGAAGVTNGTNSVNVEYSLDVSTAAKASKAITVINEAISKVSSERSKLGAVQNRLEHTINNLGTSSENLTAAESRIRDVDMAKQMMDFTKNNILTQAAQSMLAQANQQPQGVLQLLR